MKVLFLDIDGVLNSERYVRSCDYFGVIIDPERMKLLKYIIDSTSADIVLTSSWREHWNLDDKLSDNIGEDIDRTFKIFGLHITDKTPYLKSKREHEIKAWIDAHPNIENFAVLDDMFLSADFLTDHFVKTSNFRNGLEIEDAERVINILKN